MGSMASGAAAADAGAQGEVRPWEFSATAYPTWVRDGENYTSGVVSANRGRLHLQARANYESVGARSAFIGYNLAGGSGDLAWELTPLLGGAWGSINAVVPGLLASVTYKRVDAYMEAEYVDDRAAGTEAYLYAWTELGFQAAAWLRIGAAAQRTRAYGTSRELQRGPFAQATWGPVTIGAYWFNPGADAQVIVGSVGVAF
jgi:hypothetical protein